MLRISQGNPASVSLRIAEVMGSGYSPATFSTAGGRVFRRLIVMVVFLVVPALSSAQDATLTGAVKDTSGGVLPGVTVTALHEATGNTFVAVTDGVGAFRLPVRTGSYRVTVELAGFSTIVRTINLLLGQIAAVELQM